MPRHDQTGPMGYGPRTGRGAGICESDSQPDFTSQQQGLGLGYGFGRRRGFGGGMGRGRRARRAGSTPSISGLRNSALRNQWRANRN